MVKSFRLLLAIVALLSGYSSASWAQSGSKPAGCIVHVKVADVKLSTTLLIRKYIISKIVEQQQKEEIYTAKADTTIHALYVCGNRGIYYFGSGRTDHAASGYKLVYRLANNDLYMSNLRNAEAETSFYNSVFKWSDSEGCTRKNVVLTKIMMLVKENHTVVDSGVF